MEGSVSRFSLFLVSIIAVASMSLRLIVVKSVLVNNGIDLHLTAPLIFCAVFGFAGLFLSLLLSKFIAKMAGGTQIIKQPGNAQGCWLLETAAARVVGLCADRGVLKNQKGLGLIYWITIIMTEICLGVLASTGVRWFSRHREFRADKAGTHRVSRTAMLDALQTLQTEIQAQIPNLMPDAMAAFGFSRGWKRNTSRLFMTYPPLKKRIEALKYG